MISFRHRCGISGQTCDGDGAGGSVLRLGISGRDCSPDRGSRIFDIVHTRGELHRTIMTVRSLSLAFMLSMKRNLTLIRLLRQTKQPLLRGTPTMMHDVSPRPDEENLRAQQRCTIRRTPLSVTLLN